MARSKGQVRNVTLAEIARACGLSTPVVSLVLRSKTSGSIRYSQETAARVQAMAKELGYRPNRASRGHFGGRHDSIGLLVDRFFDLSSLALQAIHTEAAAQGWLLVVERHAVSDQVIPTLVREHAVDGLLLPNDVSPEVAERILELGIPAVWINTNRTTGSGVLTYDEAGGMALAVGHLKQTGRRRILHIHQPRDAHYSSAARLSGLRAACAAAALPVPNVGTLDRRPDAIGVPAPEQVVARLVDLLHLHADCDSVVTHTATAPYVYTAARRVGRDIPRDLGVVGIGGGDLTHLLDPPLTTIAVGQWDVGYKAVHALADILEGKDVGMAELPYTLHPARSTESDISSTASIPATIRSSDHE